MGKANRKQYIFFLHFSQGKKPRQKFFRFVNNGITHKTVVSVSSRSRHQIVRNLAVSHQKAGKNICVIRRTIGLAGINSEKVSPHLNRPSVHKSLGKK